MCVDIDTQLAYTTTLVSLAENQSIVYLDAKQRLPAEMQDHLDQASSLLLSPLVRSFNPSNPQYILIALPIVCD